MALVARGLLALLFTFYVNYLPFHLLSERHRDDCSSSQISATHFEDHDDADKDGHDGHHKPHPASEHSIQILPKSWSVSLCLVFRPAVTLAIVDTPDSHFIAEFAEHIWPPGESPPEPSQPRAPPFA
jgi:hypothetical protein